MWAWAGVGWRGRGQAARLVGEAYLCPVRNIRTSGVGVGVVWWPNICQRGERFFFLRLASCLFFCFVYVFFLSVAQEKSAEYRKGNDEMQKDEQDAKWKKSRRRAIKSQRAKVCSSRRGGKKKGVSGGQLKICGGSRRWWWWVVLWMVVSLAAKGLVSALLSGPEPGAMLT